MSDFFIHFFHKNGKINWTFIILLFFITVNVGVTLTVSHWTAVQSRLLNVPQSLRCLSAPFIDLTPNFSKPKFGLSARALGILWIAGKLLEIAVINWRIGRSQLIVALPVAFIFMDTSRWNKHFWLWKFPSDSTHMGTLFFWRTFCQFAFTTLVVAY